MNPTIERIVGLLFEEIEDNEETRALHEEILNNCQERYNDLIERGTSEDEAVRAVIESLNGMEEMLKSYPRKARAEDMSSEGVFRFEASAVREISLRLAQEDVEITPSSDEWVHVKFSNDASHLTAALDGGTLSISRFGSARSETRKQGLEFSIDLNGLSKLIGELAHGAFSFRTGATVHIRIPEGCRPAMRLSTASGDIELEDLSLASLDAATTSGDIRADDVCSDDLLKLCSASGDVDWSGACATLDAGTLSGDLHLDGRLAEGRAKSTSGDIDLTVRGNALHQLAAQSTSGDLDVRLPDVPDAFIDCHTVSGDVRQRMHSTQGSAVSVRLSSVSGDITVK